MQFSQYLLKSPEHTVTLILHTEIYLSILVYSGKNLSTNVTNNRGMNKQEQPALLAAHEVKVKEHQNYNNNSH